MVKPASRSSNGLLFRLGVGVLAVVAGIMLLQFLLSWILGLFKVAVLLAVLGIAVWFVLIGPPGWGDKD